jgi:hypothetical protein
LQHLFREQIWDGVGQVGLRRGPRSAQDDTQDGIKDGIRDGISGTA